MVLLGKPKLRSNFTEAQRERNRSYELHSRRLVSVKKVVDNERPSTFGRHNSQSRVAERWKAETIRRENEILLKKLVDITQDTKFRSSSVKRMSPISKLHSRSKKLEKQRINMENSFLSKRLKGLESALSFNKFLEDYKKAEQYKKQISRAHWLSPKAAHTFVKV
mmetsp:Transcript_3379/g.6952  ORF Transcript_3379/g.6952 Transcript_3379/m.6952 type:complete len:165 (-) Transcript_3379:495-989(-)